jgi:hypothetical protein
MTCQELAILKSDFVGRKRQGRRRKYSDDMRGQAPA